MAAEAEAEVAAEVEAHTALVAVRWAHAAAGDVSKSLASRCIATTNASDYIKRVRNVTASEADGRLTLSIAAIRQLALNVGLGSLYDNTTRDLSQQEASK